MTDVSKRLEQFIRKEKTLLPVKTDRGILVGDVLIISTGSIKDIFQGEILMYAGIYLNAVTIAIANLLAKRSNLVKADELYRADQEYGKWFDDSQLLRTRYQKALDNQDHDRADIFYARYCESRDKALMAKNKAQALAVL
jgi:HD superfamily phosphohydrolase